MDNNILGIDLDTPVDNLTFEQALSSLEAIVTTLEKGDVPLNRALEIYERGEKLKIHCGNLLKAVEAKVEKIRINKDDDAPSLESFNPCD